MGRQQDREYKCVNKTTANPHKLVDYNTVKPEHAAHEMQDSYGDFNRESNKGYSTSAAKFCNLTVGGVSTRLQVYGLKASRAQIVTSFVAFLVNPC